MPNSRSSNRTTARPATNHRRAGVEAGTVIEQVGDLFGRTVNQAARICGVAGPGEVIVGQGAAVILDGETRWQLESVGRLNPRGFEAPIPGYRVIRSAENSGG